jgi:hypothetical protein
MFRHVLLFRFCFHFLVLSRFSFHGLSRVSVFCARRLLLWVLVLAGSLWFGGFDVSCLVWVLPYSGFGLGDCYLLEVVPAVVLVCCLRWGFLVLGSACSLHTFK